MYFKKYEICAIWIVVSAISWSAPRYIKNKAVRKWIHTLSVTWVGVLSYKETKNTQEAVAGITLISTKIALGNAYEVSVINKKRIRKTTKAMFLEVNGDVWYCTVTDYILHPEFDEDTLNTIALIILEYDEKQFQWKLMQWPAEYARMNEHKGNVFVLGYTDRNQALEQVMHRMAYVNRSECDSFYKDEQLDSKWMAPTEFECFRVRFSSEQCVFDSGMALAAIHNGKWTLIGMSVLGPGCSLPNRFIDFARFVSWIEVTTKTSRRFMSETQVPWPNFDKLILEKLHDDTLVMRPYDGLEVIHGKCDKIDGEAMYQEESKFKAPYRGVGLYGLSLWDRLFYNITCVMLTVNCEKRSINPFSYNFSLVQYDEDLNNMVKAIPISRYNPFNSTMPPKIVHLRDGPWINWWYRENDKTNVSNVVFKFEFHKEATISVVYYGTKYPAGPTTWDEEMRPTKADDEKRSRRPHSYHLSG